MGITVKLPPMELYLKDVLEYYIKHPKHNWVVVLSPRLVGKSILLEMLLIYASLKEAGSVSMIVSPVFKQSRKIFDEISKIGEKIISKINGGAMEIEFINGSKIIFASGHQGDSLRGNTIKKSGILCIDEAVWIKEDFFYDVLVPTTNVFGSNIFVFSTPKYKNGLFYNLFLQGSANTKEERGNIKTFNWTKYDLSKYLSESTLDLYRKRLPKLTFRAEYLGEFITADGMVFSDFKKSIGFSKEDKNLPLYITIDWSTGSLLDSTAITVGQILNNKLVIPYILYFNDKKTNETCEIILDLIKDYVNKGHKEINIIVEKNSIGSIYYDVLKEKIDLYELSYNDSVRWQDEIEIHLLTVTTTNKSKKDMVERLNVLFENNLITIPNDENLINQLAAFEATISPNGTVVYAGALEFNEGHDDLVMSLGFMVNLLFNEIEIR